MNLNHNAYNFFFRGLKSHPKSKEVAKIIKEEVLKVKHNTAKTLKYFEMVGRWLALIKTIKSSSGVSSKQIFVFVF